MRLFRTTLLVSLGQFSNTFQKIALSFVLARVLSTSTYGTYQQVWLYYGLVSQLFIIGLPGSLLYFTPQLQHSEQKTMVVQTILLLAAVGSIFGAITWFTAVFVGQQFHNAALVPSLRVFSFYPVLALPSTMFSNFLIASGRPKQSALFSWVQSGLFVALASIPALLRLPLSAILWTINGYALLLLIIVVISCLWLYRDCKTVWNLRFVRSQLAYSIPLGFSGSLGSITKHLDRLIISVSLSPEQYAVYVNGAFELPFIGLITGSLMTVLIPEFVRLLRDGELTTRVWQLWNVATEKVALVLFPLCIGLLLFSRDFMVLLYSERYVSSTLIFSIYLLILPARIGQYGALLRATGHSGLILWLSVLHLVLNVVMGLLFIKAFGLPGPAVSYVLLTYVIAIIYLLVSARVTRTRFASVMPWRRLGQIMALAILSGVATLPSQLLLTQVIARVVVGSASYLVVYLLLLMGCGLVPPSEIRRYLATSRLRRGTKARSTSRPVGD